MARLGESPPSTRRTASAVAAYHSRSADAARAMFSRRMISAMPRAALAATFAA